MKFDFSLDRDRLLFSDKYKKWLELGKRIDVKVWRESKTIPQVRYLYKCFQIIADYTGYEVDEVKQLIKESCPTFWRDGQDFNGNDKRFYASIADLTKEQMAQIVDWVQQFGDSIECEIMSPDEYRAAQWDIDKQLDYLEH